MSDTFEGEGVVEGQEPAEGQEQEVHIDPNTGKTIPIERFNQVYGKAQEYEKQLRGYNEFGKPDELKAKLAKLEQWEKAVEESRKNASMSPTEQDAAKRTLQLQKELYQVLPNLKLLDKIEALEARLSENEGRYNESKTEAILAGHSQKFTGLLKTNKIDVTLQPKIEEYLVSQMNDEERQQFIKGNFKVAEDLFNRELKEGLISAYRAKSTLPTPPVRNNPGGTPPQGQPKKPMTMKEADDAAWARMHED